MTSPSYIPLEKHELQSYPPPLTSASESQIPIFHSGAPYTGQNVLMDTPDPKHNSGHHWRRVPQPKSRGPSCLSSVWDLLKALLLPMLAIAYLTFCYVVHYRVIPVKAHGLVNVSPQNIASIKAGVTSISILIVALGLWPLRDLIQDLRSEEFFRVVSTHPSGVPISVANAVSNPSFGIIDSLKAIFHHHCTPFLTAAVLTGALAVATSTLAPAALTVQTLLFDGDIQAFAVGAVGPQAVYNASEMAAIASITGNLTDNTGKAASIAYVETSIGVTYGFAAQSDSNTTSYIVPTPSELATTTSARWLSDVITIEPTCSFVKTNISQPISFNPKDVNSTGSLPVNIPDAGIDLVVSGTDINYYASINYIAPTSIADTVISLTELYNATTSMIPSDGSSVWVLTQCVGAGCVVTSQPAIYIDFSGLPMIQANTPDGTWQIVFLHCLPRMAIGTHEIRSDGTGKLTVEPDGDRSFRKQGNLNPPQTGMLLSAALSDFETNAGPAFSIDGLGTQAQLEFIFGKSAVAAINLTAPVGIGTNDVMTKLAPQALSNITAVYTTMVQAAAKVYMTGALGTAYVPGRINTSVVVFQSSLPHVIVSTFLFLLLSLLVVVAHFRSGKDERFTLFGVAAALHGSGIPGQFAQMKTGEGLSDEMLIKSLGSRLVSVNRNEDGSLSLHLS